MNALTQRFSKSYRQSGFTMIELLLVLGLIVVIAGLGMSGMFRLNAWHQLRGAAMDLQGTLNRTRLDAMKTGKPMVFRYQPGHSVFEIVSKDVFDQRNEPSTASIGSEVLQEETSAPAADGTEQHLPELFVFGMAETSDSGWSQPILFLPNGRSSDTSFFLQMTGRYPIQQKLEIRGLTGSTKFGN